MSKICYTVKAFSILQMKKSDGEIEELFNRGVAEIIEAASLRAKLVSGKKLRAKLGIDPTSPNLHIGRAVVLWKLRAFQELGHTAVLIIGDFTGLVGDTSDKDAERPMLSEKEVQKNLKSYFDQAYKILDPKKTETHFNSEWLKKLTFRDVGELADLFGLHEFEAREIISRRLKAGKRVSLRELLYPLMQGYDSMAVRADVELGGTDQKFNLLAGRVIQKHFGQNSQDIVITKLLAGTDGRKMSSSWGNTINLTDEANEIFGKVMSISDELILPYFELATNVEEAELQAIGAQLSGRKENPRTLKVRLAREIVTLYHGNAATSSAAQNFEKKFGREKDVTQIRPDVLLKKKSGPYKIDEILLEAKLVSSKSEARRKRGEGAVRFNGRKLSEHEHDDLIVFQKGDIISLGRRFLKID